MNSGDVAITSGVVFILRGESADEVVQTGLTLAGYGARSLEVTWTVPDAAAALSRLRAESAADCVGMGTVTSPRHAEAALDAGADFLATPGFEAATVGSAVDAGAAILPGVMTPGEVMQALALGVTTLKLFPGTLGPDYLRALTGPFPQVRWVPSGGVTLANVQEWMQAGAYAVGVGGAVTRLVPSEEAARAVGGLLDAVRRVRTD